MFLEAQWMRIFRALTLWNNQDTQQPTSQCTAYIYRATGHKTAVDCLRLPIPTHIIPATITVSHSVSYIPTTPLGRGNLVRTRPMYVCVIAGQCLRTEHEYEWYVVLLNLISVVCSCAPLCSFPSLRQVCVKQTMRSSNLELGSAENHRRLGGLGIFKASIFCR